MSNLTEKVMYSQDFVCLTVYLAKTGVDRKFKIKTRQKD